jgi:molecular chaperone DnaJ
MQVARQDYYEILGIPPDADGEAIRRAFRASARRLHPDVSAAPDASERFREVAEAYSVLSRPTSRLLYDRFGYRGRGQGGFAPFTRARRRAEAEARDAAGLGAEVRVPFSDALRGTTSTVRLTGAAPCRACGGRGENDGELERCPSCEGAGRVRRSSTDEFGRLLQLEECRRCGGRGRLGAACATCDGSGRRQLKGEVLLVVPAGTRDGTRIALAEAGEVLVRVDPPPSERRLLRAAAACGLVLALVLLAVVLLA